MSKIVTPLLIKHLREKNKWTQHDLAKKSGVSQAVISKYENGKRDCNLYNFNLLMKALGENPNDYSSLRATVEDKRIVDLKNELKFLLRKRSKDTCEQAELLISEKFENDKAFKEGTSTPLHRQFLLQSKATIAFYLKREIADVHKYSLEAINLSISNFSFDNISTYLLTHDEAVSINQLGGAYYSYGKEYSSNEEYERSQENFKKAINIFSQLKIAMDKSYTYGDSETRTYIQVLYNLAKSLIEIKHYEKALDNCDEGIKICRDNQHSFHLPILLFYKAYNLLYLDREKEALDPLHKSCLLLAGFGRTDELNIQMKWALDNFRISLTIPTL